MKEEKPDTQQVDESKSKIPGSGAKRIEEGPVTVDYSLFLELATLPKSQLLKKAGKNFSGRSVFISHGSHLPQYYADAPLFQLEEVPDREEHESPSGHEKTRLLVTEQIDSLHRRISELETSLKEKMAEPARSREVQACAERLSETIKSESEQTRSKLEEEICDLKKYLEKFSPNKRFFKSALAFFCFFWFCEVTYSLFSVEIVRPFWGMLGLTITTCMLIVIYFGKRESDSKKPKTDIK